MMPGRDQKGGRDRQKHILFQAQGIPCGRVWGADSIQIRCGGYCDTVLTSLFRRSAAWRCARMVSKNQIFEESRQEDGSMRRTGCGSACG